MPRQISQTKPKRPELVVANRQRTVPVDLERLRRVLNSALPRCLVTPGSDAPVLLDTFDEVEISMVSPAVMARIHRQFLDINGPTDVITFPYGEIFICPAVAQENAGKFGTHLQDELALYGIHGLLHLHGYDDISPESARRMQSMQVNILKAAQV